ncbi:hypothetical protein AKO1_015004 [Acrasis kona]|uniref:Helicase ATP-binding domain-containing protein n=1 Tax=Acrasis kona TaxID=1008807 RepID=A0AAW2Z1F3_9EUKA
MLGIFTADTQSNKTTAQVLVTVPQMLETLLLSSTEKSVKWRRRLRYVIFDEIHSINGQDSQSQCWVNCLRMIDCPFVALSATIGNAVEFGDWLGLHEQREFHHIAHYERPRPLEFSVFTPNQSQLVTVHPCAAFNELQMDLDQIKNMTAMSPRQCLQLIQASRKVHGDKSGDHLFVEQESRFASRDVLELATRDDFHSYRKGLHRRMIELASDKNHVAELFDIFKVLRQPVLEAYKVIHQAYPEQTFNSRNVVKEQLPALVNTLKSYGRLPCIMFAFDKHMIDDMMNILLNYLEPLAANGDDSLLWGSKEERNRAMTLIRPSIEKLLGCELCRDTQQDPLQCDHKQEYVEAAANVTTLRALKCGIAVHYNDMSEAYKIEIERLYRETDNNGIVLPIVISTSTLALGVHMPARSVIMCGTSIYLDNTMFSQCSGRSGRRGFDPVGHVVMMAFPRVQVNRYMTAETTHATGPCGMTPSFILRLMNLIAQTKAEDDNKYLRDSCLKVLDYPIFLRRDRGIDQSSIDQQMKHQFRFALELLRRTQHLNAQGQPLKYSGIINEMYYAEPNNYLLVMLLRQGILDGIVRPEWPHVEIQVKKIRALESEKSKILIQLKLLKVESRITKDPVRVKKEVDALKEEQYNIEASIDKLREEVRFSDEALYRVLRLLSFVIEPRPVFSRGRQCRTLPPMPPRITKLATKLQQAVSDCFTEYVNSYARMCKDHILEDGLPLSDSVLCNKQECSGALADRIASHAVEYSSASSFAALSGHFDQYKDMDQLLSCVNYNIVLDRSIIPDIDVFLKHRNQLNSYALDFYQHGSLKRLVEENALVNENTAKNQVFGFVSQLRSTARCLDKIGSEHSAVGEALTQIASKFSNYMFTRNTNAYEKRIYKQKVMEEYRKRAKEEKLMFKESDPNREDGPRERRENVRDN